MKHIINLLVILIFTACGSSDSEPVDISYKSTFNMFNARNVANDMQMQIEVNDESDYNKSIRYSKQDSYDVWWYDDDNVTIKYSQDDNLDISFPIAQKHKGKYLICSMGNVKNSTLPLVIQPIDIKEIREGEAYIKVINAINDGIDKRVYINYEFDKSDFISFNTSSDKFYINASTNSLVYVQYRDVDVPFIFDESINFNPNSAYFIIIYESKDNPEEPKIEIIEMTP
jgi:uncharacterized protein YcfL